MQRTIVLLSAFLAVSLTALSTGRAEGSDLTGTWKDDNGGRYQVRQIGDELYWYMDLHPTAINVFHGKIEDKTVSGKWADLPGGQVQQAGKLDLRIESDSRLVKVWSSIYYGGSVWYREEGTGDSSSAMNVSGHWTGPWTNTRGERGTSYLDIAIDADGAAKGMWDGDDFSGGRRIGNVATWSRTGVAGGCRDYQVRVEFAQDGRSATLTYNVRDKCREPQSYSGEHRLTK